MNGLEVVLIFMSAAMLLSNFFVSHHAGAIGAQVMMDYIKDRCVFRHKCPNCGNEYVETSSPREIERVIYQMNKRRSGK